MADSEKVHFHPGKKNEKRTAACGAHKKVTFKDHPVRVTLDKEKVTCGACKRRKVYKEAT